ncbi:glucose-fructose oxidoreductase [Minicystis rosea]|nr:glucose-fructose oxidoreductase [Minicystis rosea]
MGHPRRRPQARHLEIAERPPLRLPSIHAPTERESEEKPTPLPPEERVGYAVVGLGRLALEEVLPALRSSMSSRLVALVSGDPEKAARVAAAYGISPQSVYDYRSFDRIRDDPKIEAVYIATPNALHPEHAIRAAEAGKHVLCEKPMANSVADCDAMIAAAADAQRLLMIAYRLQYEPHNRAAIDIVRRKTLGAAKLIEAVNVQHQGDPRQWRLRRALAGGGALPDIGIYCLSAARYLTGEEPIEISATMYSTPGDPRFREVEETVSFNLRFPSGVMAVCTTSYGAHESRRYRMMAENGWVDLDPAFSYGGLRMHVGRKRDAAVEEVSEQRRDERSQFAREIDHFSQCVRNGQKPHTPGEEGRQDVLLMEAIYAAARRGRPVRLPELGVLDAFRGPPPDLG